MRQTQLPLPPCCFLHSLVQPPVREGPKGQTRNGTIHGDGPTRLTLGRRSGELLAQSGRAEGAVAGGHLFTSHLSQCSPARKGICARWPDSLDRP